jgi:hypothetical protein
VFFLCDILSGENLSRPGRRLPVDVLDIVSVGVLPKLIKIQTPPSEDRAEFTLQKIGALFVRVQRDKAFYL